MKVLVTGASGNIGSRVTDALRAAPEVDEIVGLSRRRPDPVPDRLLRGAVDLTWRLRLQPTDPGWIDIVLRTPLLDTTRIRDELGWVATRSSEDSLAELLGGIEEGAGGLTPPLDPAESGPLRVNEVVTGIGARAQP